MANESSKTQPARSICVYCGSGNGKSPAYRQAAEVLGAAIANAGYGLVYGGGSLGLMGTVAKSALDAGGYVTGIIPAFLSDREMMLKDVDDLVVTEDMHQRKMLMFEKSDAFIALPGGIGTLEELVEQLTWSQLGQHTKPVVVANITGYWNPFLNLLEEMRREEFIRKKLQVEFAIAETAEEIVPKVEAEWAAIAEVDEGKSIPKRF
ncbi:MAG: TIGR00730 family Rossman fold protein [Pseudomonadota bacterium]